MNKKNSFPYFSQKEEVLHASTFNFLTEKSIVVK